MGFHCEKITFIESVFSARALHIEWPIAVLLLLVPFKSISALLALLTPIDADKELGAIA
jgi:hypothetical protein